MIKQIRVEQLKPGMFIADLNCGWLDHPFLTNAFAVPDQGTVDKIAKIGIRELYIDTVKGADVWEGRPQQDVNADLERRLQEIAEKQQQKPITADLAQESGRARRLHVEANKMVRNLMDGLRSGEKITVDRLDPMVDSLVESLFRNQDALLPLARLKNHDDYTFQHSVSVSALMVAFARAMNLDRDVIHHLAVGALLHDFGKVRIPDTILNKPARLSDTEFDRMKSHVTAGLSLLEGTPGISTIALQVVGEHHERMDATGYPNRLGGEGISLYGQMAAIVDVYDAISSERVYHKGMPPPQALKKLLEWSKHHFDPQLVQTFIRAVGIYPTGTLVRLESNRLGVVIEQTEGKLLEPTVRVFYHGVKQHYMPPEVVELSKVQDRIASVESYDKWKIDPYQWLPS
jgi:putative nucleotidyltransferase with HDIG domain